MVKYWEILDKAKYLACSKMWELRKHKKNYEYDWHLSVAILTTAILAAAFVFKFDPVTSGNEKLLDFPQEILLVKTGFVNWADEIISNDLWTAYPKSAEEIVTLANWAKNHSFTIRASGAMHNWSPLTVDPSHNSIYDIQFYKELLSANFSPTNGKKVILVKTQRFLNKMKIISADHKNASFWAEPGVILDDLLLSLEEHNLGISNFPAIGEITLGGALAIGAHGTGILAVNETLLRGHSFGSLSNLILEFTAVVYDQMLGEYTLKNFQRTDKESGAFLVNLGKTFLTNISLQAGPLKYLRCESFMDIPMKELIGRTEGNRTVSNILNTSGRIELIWFPFTTNPWIKVWTGAETKPETSDLVTSPYNYGFTDRIPEYFAMMAGKYIRENDNVKFLNYLSLKLISFCLTATNTWDIWGTSRAVFHYVRPTTLKMTEAGWAVVTSRENIEKAIGIFYRIYTKKLEMYEKRGEYPINGPLGVRITGVDNPEDVGIKNAQVCGLCPGSPVPRRPDLNVVIWFNILSFPRSYKVSQFMADVQNSLAEDFRGDWAILRIEWSKGFAYSRPHTLAWNNNVYLKKIIPDSLPHWELTKRVLNKYDPFGIFSNTLLNKLFED